MTSQSRRWWQPRPRRLTVVSLDQHPNSREVRGILDRLPTLTEQQIARLAHGWRDSAFLAHARNRALSPDSHLIIEVLTAFDALDGGDADPAVPVDSAVPADPAEPAGPDPAVPVTFGTALKPQIGNIAKKAIRDAMAAAYARPILGRADYIALIGPWRRTFPADD